MFDDGYHGDDIVLREHGLGGEVVVTIQHLNTYRHCKHTSDERKNVRTYHVISCKNDMYSRSGNFRVKKLSYDKFSCKEIFVGTTPYRISVNSAY